MTYPAPIHEGPRLRERWGEPFDIPPVCDEWVACAERLPEERWNS